MLLVRKFLLNLIGNLELLCYWNLYLYLDILSQYLLKYFSLNLDYYTSYYILVNLDWDIFWLVLLVGILLTLFWFFILKNINWRNWNI